MLKKIIKLTSSLVLSIVLISLILFTEATSARAEIAGFAPPEDYREDGSQEMNFEKSNDDKTKGQIKGESSLSEIFENDQVFPFEMGLGN